MKLEIVGISEIAGMFGVTKQAVSTWTSRYEDFPAPLAKLAMGPIFYKKEIRRWGRKNNRL